jgi:hypothetical protein
LALGCALVIGLLVSGRLRVTSESLGLIVGAVLVALLWMGLRSR